MTTKDRVSPSGPQSSVKTTIAIASTAVALTAAATATASLPEARVGDVVTVSPQANLNASLAIAFARVVDDDIVVIGFTNVGASTNTGASTYDAVVQQR
jgi:hypothetical protein